MKKNTAITLANERSVEKQKPHYVVYEPATYRDIFDNTGYQVKSEQQMIADYGKIPSFMVVHEGVQIL
ncbi:hypothetical protein PP175_28825 (plasmid) [Aneurinibacillus sp. Ricciae_BoGa-3]|uniref:hypothetical protein n=1 Tax=Aneurinibacillus sp. Ricciae_BoGa-3 TaxID=3022697 RepID=UPI0023422F50|nr:hypothetical protein [Aneurinibacillus sp. Ricciae_BoGa-3]WCK57195.1 hypothetical protein PP175_28825 [Aneurinibacillus sp. Ricciae_BoGa-3]